MEFVLRHKCLLLNLSFANCVPGHVKILEMHYTPHTLLLVREQKTTRHSYCDEYFNGRKIKRYDYSIMTREKKEHVDRSECSHKTAKESSLSVNTTSNAFQGNHHQPLS